jgi:hypothetical protein
LLRAIVATKLNTMLSPSQISQANTEYGTTPGVSNPWASYDATKPVSPVWNQVKSISDGLTSYLKNVATGNEFAGQPLGEFLAKNSPLFGSIPGFGAGYGVPPSEQWASKAQTATKEGGKPLANLAMGAMGEGEPEGAEDLTESAKGGISNILDHIKAKGGVTADFNGNIKNSGYAFSILDKADETQIPAGDNFEEDVWNKYNELGKNYSNNPNAHFGGWTNENGNFIVDVSHVTDDLKQALYDASLKRQTAIGDLAKYAKGEDGTINITKAHLDSLQPPEGSVFEGNKTAFKNWEEVKQHYALNGLSNTPEIDSEVFSLLKK